MRTLLELFPDIADHRKPAGMIRYIQERMAEMADADELYLTECLSLPPPINDLVAKAVMGITVRDNKEVPGQRIPRELSGYDITLRAIEFDRDTILPDGKAGKEPVVENICFDLPRIEMDTLTKKEALAEGMSVHTSASGSKPNVVDLGAFEGEVSPEEAVYALRVAGKDVRRARGTRQQRAFWKFEEVHPPNYPKGKKAEAAPKSKPRPRRRKPAAAKAQSGKA